MVDCVIKLNILSSKFILNLSLFENYEESSKSGVCVLNQLHWSFGHINCRHMALFVRAAYTT